MNFKFAQHQMKVLIWTLPVDVVLKHNSSN